MIYIFASFQYGAAILSAPFTLGRVWCLPFGVCAFVILKIDLLTGDQVLAVKKSRHRGKRHT